MFTESKTIAAREMPVAVAFRCEGSSPLLVDEIGGSAYKEGKNEERKDSTTSAPSV